VCVILTFCLKKTANNQIKLKKTAGCFFESQVVFGVSFFKFWNFISLFFQLINVRFGGIKMNNRANLRISVKLIYQITAIVAMLVLGFLIGKYFISSNSQDEVESAYQNAYNYILDEKWQLAQSSLEKFIQNINNSKRDEDARYWYCFSLEKMANSKTQVFEEYEKFIKDYPKGKWVDEAKTTMIGIGSELASYYQDKIYFLQQEHNDKVSLSALYELYVIGSEQFFNTAINMYDSSSSERIKSEIIDILRKNYPQKAIPKFMEIVKNDQSLLARIKSIDCLGKNNSDESIIALKQIIQSNIEDGIRAATLSALYHKDIEVYIQYLKSLEQKKSNDSIVRIGRALLRKYEKKSS
jgi:hypothetical protein